MEQGADGVSPASVFVAGRGSQCRWVCLNTVITGVTNMIYFINVSTLSVSGLKGSKEGVWYTPDIAQSFISVFHFDVQVKQGYWTGLMGKGRKRVYSTVKDMGGRGRQEERHKSLSATKSSNMQTTISRANSNNITKRIEKEMNKKCTKMIVLKMPESLI